MYLQKHINTATKLIKQYPYPLPFATYLKQYFTLNKKHGSRDRKFISQACYSFWRLGNCFTELPIEEKILIGLFLSPKALNWQDAIKEEWKIWVDETLEKRVDFVKSVYPSFSTSELFFWEDELSPLVGKEIFALSHLSPSKTYLRLRPKQAQNVENNLQKNNLIYQNLNPNYIAFNEPINIEKYIQLNRQAVVQDFSSGQVLNYFLDNKIEFEKPITLWDCCAASGGKSILATDVLPIKKLCVTDVRLSILHNLQQRFKEAGISNYESKVLDVANDKNKFGSFDIVIADCPCTGSGTWGRNPEHLNHFKKETISQYFSIQKSIIENASKSVNPNGYLVYITCSAFKQENEEVVQHILQKTSFTLRHQQLILGYLQHADTMFVAIFNNEVK